MSFTRLTFSAVLAAYHVASWPMGPVVLAESLKQNDFATGAIKIGRRTVVLPEGTWQLIATSVRSASDGGAAQAATLQSLEFQEVRDRRLNRLLQVVATTYSHTANWLDEPCKVQGDSYWIDDRSRSTKDQFCIRVGFKSEVVDGARGATFQAWARDLKARSVGYSPEMPFVVVTRFTTYDYLQMSVSFDPAASGIGASRNPGRAFNDWNVLGIAQQTANAKFMDALVAWAPKYAAAVQRAFDGDEALSTADYGEPSLPPKP